MTLQQERSASSSDHGTIVLYQTKDGQATLDVHLQDETVWLTQAQMVELFQRDKRTVSEHIRNIFKEGELNEEAVVRKSRTTAVDGKSYSTAFYNLDVIISVGYRVKSQRGTQFRIWATSVLKDYLVQGYALNQRRLAEKGVAELRGMLDLLATTLEEHQLADDTGLEVLRLVRRYELSWQLLLQFDEDRLPLPETGGATAAIPFDLLLARQGIDCLRNELAAIGETTELFGQERGASLAGILGSIHQTFDGYDLYPSIEEKAAHLLYFIIKDHPFADGNKRIGAFLFVLYLHKNGLSETVCFDNKGLVALALLVASSAPDQKELLVRLTVNLLTNSSNRSNQEGGRV